LSATLLSLGDVAVRYGATTILHDVGFTVSAGQRWGIVGRNGAGKTTLFRLITRAEPPSQGTVHRAPGLRLIHLDQHRDFGAADTVWDAAAQGFADLIALEERLGRTTERLAELGDRATEADLERYGREQEEFSRRGGYQYQARIEAVLQGLGFDPAESRARQLGSLSGGERGRVGLVAPLASPADLLLLDEPTNHLDLETTEWLTGYLKGLDETVMVISHDRAFLDEVVDHVLHVHAGTTRDYRGGYSDFVRQRAERELSERRAFEQQQDFIRKEEDYIRRNIAGQNTAQAKGRRKRLERLPRLSPPPGEEGAMAIHLEPGARGGDRVVGTEALRLEVGDRVLLEDATVVAMRGDVIALVGSNGAGKSTLLATLLGARDPDGGVARLGQSITAAWYRQDLAGVPLDRPIFDLIHDLRPSWTRGQVQGHLGAFGFSGEEVRRSTSSLSGGERARVALAMITLARANLIVLDEPTNHLDVESIEVLEDAIDEFEGTTILVSHDRAFLRELATRVWSIEEGRLDDFHGTFVEWEVRRVERRRTAEAARAAEAAAQIAANRVANERQRRERLAPGQQRRAAERKAAEAEAAVGRLEREVARLEASLAEPTLYDEAGGAARARELGEELSEARARLADAMAAWEAAALEAGG